MPNNPPVYYWDASVLLAWVKGEDDRVAIVQGLLDDAMNGRIEILTSMVSIVEVSNGVTQASGRRDFDLEAKIDSLWRPPYQIQLVEFYRSIANRSRDLMRRAVDLARKLTPLDAVHLATAVQMEADRVHTYDPLWREWESEIGLPVEEPTGPRVPML